MSKLAPPPSAAPPAGPAARRPRPSTLWTPDGFPTPAMLAEAGDPPDGAPMTRAQFRDFEPKYLAELVDGRISYLPMASRTHQRAAIFFLDLLRAEAKRLGHAPEVLIAPFDLSIPNANVREPDVVMLLDRDDPRNREHGWAGADLAVEIVSPSDPNRDLVEKREEYAAAGIAEYWIVDPRPRRRSAPTGRSVTVLRLGEGGTYTGEPADEGAAVESRLLPGLSVPVTDCLGGE